MTTHIGYIVFFIADKTNTINRELFIVKKKLTSEILKYIKVYSRIISIRLASYRESVKQQENWLSRKLIKFATKKTNLP